MEATGQLIQWAIKLSEFDVRYQLRSAIKVQVLADFITEFTPSQRELDELDKAQRWIVHVDGLSALHTGGIGVVLQTPKGNELKYKVHLQYSTTNSEVEYEALHKGLELAKSLEVESLLT